jgi:uncharacterized membrane protein YsdA (DUF1294 family)
MAWLLIGGGLAAINLLTWSAFAGDKRAAIRGERRTPERTLLWLALLGGGPAAVSAQRMLRHKTRKAPFRTLLLAILCLQLLALSLAVGWAIGWLAIPSL